MGMSTSTNTTRKVTTSRRQADAARAAGLVVRMIDEPMIGDDGSDIPCWLVTLPVVDRHFVAARGWIALFDVERDHFGGYDPHYALSPEGEEYGPFDTEAEAWNEAIANVEDEVANALDEVRS